MNPFASILLSIRALGRNKVRTFLTMLGIVIGIASVIAMVAIGQGASKRIEAQINAMGRNLMMVLPGAISSGGFSMGSGSITTLTPEDGVAIQKEVGAVDSMTPVVRARGLQLVYGSVNWAPSQIMGVSPAFVEVRDWPTEEGAFFSEADVASAAKVCVLGKTVADNLFQGDQVVGQVIRVKNIPFKVVGVLIRKGTSGMGTDQDDLMVCPWLTVKMVLQGSAFRNIDQLLVSASSAAELPEAVTEITALLRQRHKIRDGELPDFRIMLMSEMMSTQSETTKTMTILLTIVAAISMLVGGIGIMNIMLVSVVERTREIGLRMAVGARQEDILLQFLMEAVVLAIVAGLIGMAFGVAAALLIPKFLGWQTVITPASIGVSFLVSFAVGVFFGFYPALRASRLDPIEALRYE
jgi:putative ABC transport system permease protein